jgi:rsbT co-antagonist protein RsbR
MQEAHDLDAAEGAMSSDGSVPGMDDRTLAEHMLHHIADILVVVADVGSGDYTVRLQSRLPEDNPVTTLLGGINEMIDSLARAQERSDLFRKELEEKLATIEVQRAAIRELSTPVIEVWEGVLCLPVVGVLDTTRSAEMTESLLSAIVEKKADCAIIDITGIQVMDTGTADHFLRMARAVQLLGAECLLTGINPAIAQTIIHMGVDLSGVVTHRTMRTALQYCIDRLVSREKR